MADFGLTPFIRLFPSQGIDECRSLTTRGDGIVPDDDYALLESYCDDPSCHCRRVMLNVVARHQQATVASISVAFDRDDPLAGPFLDPLNPQAPYAGALLDLVRDMLADPRYVARLEAHYYQVKGAVADPAFRRPGQPRPTSAPARRIGRQPAAKSRRKRR
jgi:hypothetical protein